MSAVSLADAKAHLRIVHTSDDAYITGLIETAEAYVTEVGVALAAPIQPPVKHAVFLLISHFYENRDASSDRPSAAIAFGVDALLQPYREQAI
jgi:uncharacterized phage protein (predicted DNA packaging)